MKEWIRKWTGWKAAVKTACFLLVLALVLGRVDEVLSLKSTSGIDGTRQFYRQEKGLVDLLLLGNSHIFMNADPGVLWDEYGIAAYDLGSGNLPFWTAYYVLKEALKTQTPRLIVMDAYTATFADEYVDNFWVALNTFGMKWSWDKVEAIRLSVPPDKRSEMLLTYCQYHTRTRRLARNDFLEDMVDTMKYASWKGAYNFSKAVSPRQWPAEVQTEERKPMTAKTEEWYRKTIQLAQAGGVPLLMVASPYPDVTAEHQAIYNTAADIAGEYGVPFINFNRDFEALDLDPASDYIDGHHMSVWGGRKFTGQLGKLLAERYDLPDRRGDPAYQSWEDNARYIEAYARDGRLALGVTPEEAASLLPDPDYTCAVGVRGDGGTAFAPLLEALGVPAGAAGLWLVSGGEVLWSSGPGDTAYFPLDWHDLKLSGAGGANTVVFDKGAVEQIGNGVTIFVYDTVTQAEAARLTFDVAAPPA